MLAVLIEVILHALSASIQQSIHDFRSESSEWENEVLELFDDLDQFLAGEGQVSEAAAAADLAEDVAGLKGLVEQQTDVLAALVNALTGQPGSTEDASEDTGQTGNSDLSEVDPFERLQQAVEAAAEAS